MTDTKQLSTITELCNLIDSAIESHEKFTIVWHNNKSIEIDIANPFMQIVAKNHLMNFKLWHIEDIARRTDASHEIIANCKHEIDLLNQKRTDYYELIDTHFISQLANLTNIAENAPKNTESIGMIIDRLSILSLKIYHMTEELNRRLSTDSDYSLIKNKLTTLTNQKLDLVSAVKYLIGEYVDGKKGPMTYKQFKMYNDPTLNPELYNL